MVLPRWVPGLFLTPGFGACGAVLAVTPAPVLEVGNTQSVPVFPLLLEFPFTVAGMTPVGRTVEKENAVFSPY